MKKNSWELMNYLGGECDLRWTIFGDFNGILFPSEKLRAADFDFQEAKEFMKCSTLGGCAILASMVIASRGPVGRKVMNILKDALTAFCALRNEWTYGHHYRFIT